jgi:outer membrane protein
MKFISHEPDLEAGLGKRPAAIVLSGVVILLIVGLTYTLFDFGKRRELVRERETLRAQADENLRCVQDGVEQRVRKSHRNVERALQMVDVARESLELRRESERLTKDQFELGLALKSAYAESQAAAASSDADMFRAEAGWRLAVAELKKEIALR